MQNDVVTIYYDTQTVSNERIITEEEKINLILKEYEEEINFFAQAFQIDPDVLKEKLHNDFESLNINEDTNFAKTLIDYLFNLEDTNKELFMNNKIPCDITKEEMLNLINYYCHIYGNVDYSLAASIAEIESGFSSKVMLNKNNIYGGLANGKIISYKTIQYGILKYIKLLSEGYIAKGLTTIDAIGVVYNPVIENGVKKANPSWVNKINNAQEKYLNYIAITNVSELDNGDLN